MAIMNLVDVIFAVLELKICISGRLCVPVTP